MILFDFFITLIECIIISVFIAYALDLKEKHRIILFLSIMLLCVIQFFNYIFVNNLLMTIIEVITILFVIKVHSDDFKFTYIFITLLSLSLNIASIYISMFISSMLFNIPFDIIRNNDYYFINVTLFSKIIYIILTILFLVISNRISNNLSLSKWWPYLIFILITLLLMAIIGEDIIYNYDNIYANYIVVLGLLFLIFLSFVIYYLLNKEAQEKIEYIKKITKIEYINKNYSRMNYIYNKTVKEKHQMNYILLSIKNSIINQSYEEAISMIDNGLIKNNNVELVKSTLNPYFDFILHEKLQEYQNKGFNIKTIIQLNYIVILSQEDLVENIFSYFDEIINYADENKNMVIDVRQNKKFLIIRFYVSSRTDAIKLNEIKNEYIKKVELSNSNGYLNLKFLISIEE